jgi:hypothetical protein
MNPKHSQLKNRRFLHPVINVVCLFVSTLILASFTLSHAQSQKQGIDMDITFAIPFAVPFALTLLEDGKLVGRLETPLGSTPLSLTRARRLI